MTLGRAKDPITYVKLVMGHLFHSFKGLFYLQAFYWTGLPCKATTDAAELQVLLSLREFFRPGTRGPPRPAFHWSLLLLGGRAILISAEWE